MSSLALALALALALLASTGCGSSSSSANNPHPTGGRCARGEYYLPGCSDEPGIVAGCYERCATSSAACGAGTTCAIAHVMPACALGAGDAACDACGEDVMLCLPSGE
jgi:hypothetical protein